MLPNQFVMSWLELVTSTRIDRGFPLPEVTKVLQPDDYLIVSV